MTKKFIVLHALFIQELLECDQEMKEKIENLLKELGEMPMEKLLRQQLKYDKFIMEYINFIVELIQI